MQGAIDSAEFFEWQWAEARGELLDDYDRFGMVASMVANHSMSPPKKPLTPDDFRPKKAQDQRQIELNAAEVVRVKRTSNAKPELNDLTWQT